MSHDVWFLSRYATQSTLLLLKLFPSVYNDDVLRAYMLG